MILNALDGKPLPVYGDGKQIRDWLYVEDHCEAILVVLRDGKTGETYTSVEILNLPIVQAICSILDERLPNSKHVPHKNLIYHVADRPGHDRRYAMNITKISAELGWKPRESLNSGLQKTIEWYLDHPEWVEIMRDRGDYQRWMEQNYAKRREGA